WFDKEKLRELEKKLLQAVIGSSNFSSEQLAENYKVVYSKITELKPTG
ncbi:2352_t:CDS:1, partial [Racocetra persica]